MFSAVHPTTDIAKILRHVRFVPTRDSCTAAKSSSFDHLVGQGEQRWWHLQAEAPGRLEIDDKLEFGRLLDQQVDRPCALKDLVDISRGAAAVASDHEST
jgi:hypothetical protein